MYKILISVLMLISSPLFSEVKVLAFSGSLREESYNKSLAREAVKMANDAGASATFIDLRDIPLPFFDEDIQEVSGMPENAKLLRNMILESDVIIITSPNYNDSFSGVLKNALDWVSRTEDGKDGRGIFKGKKVAIMCASPGKNGIRGLRHLRDVITKCGGELLPSDFGIPAAHDAFDQEGNLHDLDLKIKLNDVIMQVVVE